MRKPSRGYLPPRAGVLSLPGRTPTAISRSLRKRWRSFAELTGDLFFRTYAAVAIRPEDAQDITQDFFLMILKTNWLRQADQSRGRFRSLLLKSVQNFLHNVTDTKQTLKRGGGVDFVSWDAWMAEAPSQISISPRALASLAPERLFDLRWAATVVEQALRRLREECEGKGRLRLFEGLRDYLAAEHADISYANLAVSLGIAETVVKKQLHNLRERYRWLLRDEVAHTVAHPADVDDEIRHLCAALAAAA